MGRPRPVIPPEPELPKLGSDALPAPPQQTSEWKAPSLISTDKDRAATEASTMAELAEAVQSLFALGLADPRGCEYRNIEVVTAGYRTTKTHGWVFPQSNEANDKTQQQRFGICWNGLVYPLVSVGEPADLRMDVEAVLKVDKESEDSRNAEFTKTEKLREEDAKRKGETFSPGLNFNFRQTQASEIYSADFQRMGPLRAALLLRLGEGELAVRMWQQWFSDGPVQNRREPFLVLAGEWARYKYDRAVSAHRRGDHRLALVDARELTALAAQINTKAQKLDKKGSVSDKRPFLYFLAQLPQLLADSERRVKEPAYKPVLSTTPPPTGKARIDGLIRDLEQATGGRYLRDSPIVNALTEAGPDAIEPLLQCLESDTRLTRFISPHRDFSQTGSLVEVNQAAYDALIEIVRADYSSLDPARTGADMSKPEGRRAMAEKIRAYWNQNKGITMQERWFLTLQDDRATKEQWLEAAENITLPANTSKGNIQALYMVRNSSSPQFHGDVLRTKTNPSVSDLMVRRMADLSGAPDPGKHDDIKPAKVRMAKALAEWDGKAHLADLQRFSATLRSPENPDKYTLLNNVDAVLELDEAREKLGDTTIAAEYAEWLPRLPRNDFGLGSLKLYRTMWQNPHDPAIRQMAEQLFNSPDSSWVKEVGKRGFPAEMAKSPLIGLEAFRKVILRNLNDKTERGSVYLNEQGTLIDASGGYTSHETGLKEDPLAPEAGTPVRYRVCDEAAAVVSEVQGAPLCRLYWPEARRDEAVAACIIFLQKFGDNYQWQGDEADGYGQREVKTVIHFPRLDHPARRKMWRRAAPSSRSAVTAVCGWLLWIHSLWLLNGAFLRTA